MRLMLNVSVTLDRDNLKKLESDVIHRNRVSYRKEVGLDVKEQEPISPLESYEFIGSYKKVCGTVSQVYKRNDVGYLNFGGNYPNQKFVVYITKLADYADIDDLEKHFICITGTIDRYRGIPQIENPVTFGGIRLASLVNSASLFYAESILKFLLKFMAKQSDSSQSFAILKIEYGLYFFI